MPDGRRRLLLIGAGGHARAVIDVVQAGGAFDIVGLIDSFQPAGTEALGYRVLGGESDIPALCRAHAVQALFVAIGDNYQRAAMSARLRAALPQLQFATLVHPSTVVGTDVTLGQGSVVMPGAVIMGGSRIGEGCVLNTASSLDHDGVMDDWSALGPGGHTGGKVQLGARSFVGLGASVIHGVTIGADTFIGAGAVVVGDIPGNVVAFGLPCQVRRSRAADESHLA